MPGIDEILDALADGRSTLDEAAAALLREQDEAGGDDDAIRRSLERRVAEGVLAPEAAAVLLRRAPVGPAPGELTMLRPAPQAPDAVAQVEPTPFAVSRPEASGSSSSGWREWAQSGVPAARIGVGDVLRERFVLEAAIGKGGMGLVFKARDQRREEARDRDPYVAIKILGDDFKSHPDALIALQREARRMQRLSHPNIASVYDFDRDGTHVYLVMELLEGESLDKVLARQAGTGLPLQQARRLIEDAGSALRHAHTKGLVHSDFKPANVFVTSSGEVKIIDFGIARIAKDTSKGADAVGTVFDAGHLGAYTNAYASPEQILSAAEPDPRDDVYAFGLVAYEALSGKHPFGRKSAVEAQFRSLKPEPLSVLDARQNEVLAAALSFDRAQRPEDVMALVRALVPDDEVIVATRDGPARGTAPQRDAADASKGRRIGRTVALAVAGLAWIGFFAIYWSARDEKPPIPGAATDDPVAAIDAPAAATDVPAEPAVRPAPPVATASTARAASASAASQAPAGSSPVTGPPANATGDGQGPPEPAAATVASAAEDSIDAIAAPEDELPDPPDAAGEATELPVAAAASAPAAQPQSGPPQLYRWVDKDGKAQFGSNPPPEYASTAIKVMDL